MKLNNLNKGFLKLCLVMSIMLGYQINLSQTHLNYLTDLSPKSHKKLDTNMSRQKGFIFYSIINDAFLKFKLKEDSTQVFVLLDIQSTSIKFHTGYDEEFVSVSKVFLDTISMSLLQDLLGKRFKKINFKVKSKDSEKYYRPTLIKSIFFEPFTKNENDQYKDKVYIEISTPIEGWGPIYLFDQIREKKRMENIDFSYYLKYNTKDFFIPVYIWFLKNRNDIKKTLLYKFRIEGDINSTMQIKLLDNLELN